MIYLIDGHNLIPKVPGLALGQVDVETLLLERLQVFARVRRKQVEVFFDGAPPGQSGKRKAGTITVHFVRLGRTADESIVARLDQMKAAAQNALVITSDRRVQTEARNRHAQVIPSEQFAGQLQEAQLEAQFAAKNEPKLPGEGELKEWLRLFGEKE
jgi:hypothetical protein